jgi:hypothetical protein
VSGLRLLHLPAQGGAGALYGFANLIEARIRPRSDDWSIGDVENWHAPPAPGRKQNQN